LLLRFKNRDHQKKGNMTIRLLPNHLNRKYEEGKVGWILLWLLGIPIPVLLILFLLIAPPQTSAIRGRVLDSRTLEPIEKATVSIRDHRIETRTGANGEFELPALPAGEVELYVTTVGYALVRKKLELNPPTPLEVEVLLGPDVLRRTDEITLTEKL